MPFRHSDRIEVKRVRGKGRGVFARVFLEEGCEIERVPVLVLPEDEVCGSDDCSLLGNYCFYWAPGKVALALGYGSLYNHSYTPNATYLDLPNRTKLFRAIRDIQPGEEITVNYNGDPADNTDVGFSVLP